MGIRSSNESGACTVRVHLLETFVPVSRIGIIMIILIGNYMPTSLWEMMENTL